MEHPDPRPVARPADLRQAHPDLPVVVIGSGPVGLAAAAHLLERGLPTVVLEAGGAVAAHVETWGHVRLFSPWSQLVDAAARRLLAGTGWEEPASCDHPTGAQWRASYLLPLAAALDAAAPGGLVRTGHRATAITREGRDLVRDDRDDRPFLVHVLTVHGAEVVRARAVIDATGTLATPGTLGASGVPAEGEEEGRRDGAITSAIPVLPEDRSFHGAHTAVVGAGHSALTALIGLADVMSLEPATRVTWVLRRPLRGAVFGGGDADALTRRSALGQVVRSLVDSGVITVVDGFAVQAVDHAEDGTRVLVAADGRRLRGLDRIVSLTGYRPDLSLTVEVRLDLDPSVQAPRALAPLIDPNVHSCGTVPPHGVAELSHPERDLYVVGMKSYGRAPTFLALTGYEQVRSVVAALAGDDEAAQRIELQLPETGVCGGSGVAEPLAGRTR